jgi:FkbM family methyltransferase
MGIVSYAQNFEDVLLDRVFAGVDDGFYVDVGAYHPVDDSVTKTFYDRGWSGINIEPGEVFETLAAARPRDVNLNLAVYDRAGEIEFAQHPGWHAGLSHVRDGARDGSVVRDEASATPAPAMRRVACDTLTAILAAHAAGRPIAFLKIDAEGAEPAIVRSTDWRAIRPTVLLIEATRPLSTELANQEWEPILLAQGYIRAWFDGINCFYVPEERADLLARFALPVNVLDGFVRHDPALDACREELRTALERVHALADELRELEAEHSRCVEQQAAQLETIRAQEAVIAGSRPPASESPPAGRFRWRGWRGTGWGGAGWRGRLRPVLRRLYIAARPVARPLAARGRSFLTAELRADIARLEERLLGSSGGGQADMQAFGKMLETTLLTLTLENSRKER